MGSEVFIVFVEKDTVSASCGPIRVDWLTQLGLGLQGVLLDSFQAKTVE
jgi:hypothetical protein